LFFSWFIGAGFAFGGMFRNIGFRLRVTLERI
jgi:hypothetical protein